MINKFIENYLNIKKYNKTIYHSWKDNLTCEISTDKWMIFIIQQMFWKKTNKNIRFIDEVIDFINKKNNISIFFANKYLKYRFIKYEWCTFQVMKKINWKTIKEENINIALIKETAKYIATFHKNIEKFNYDNYVEINYYKKMHRYRLELIEILKNNSNDELEEIFNKMNSIALPLSENPNLPIWIIHWDPSFKNFLINSDWKIVGLIDYDMLSVNSLLWDLADLTRSYMKTEVFNRKEFYFLINSYNEIRKLTSLEKKELKNYCIMMILDTWFRYLLSYFESNEHNNLIWNKEDSLIKASRCLKEIEKLNTFYK